MRQRDHYLGGLCVLVLLVATGCAHQRAEPPSQLPATDVLWPATTLTLPWNGEHFAVPEPVVVPRKSLAEGLKDWDRSRSVFWKISLEEGRSAVVQTTRDFTPVLCMQKVWIYRPDGTLEVEQYNDSGKPNEPAMWTVYEKDGRTKYADVRTERSVREPRRYVSEVILYHDGVRSLRYVSAESGVVQYEEQINPDGSTTLVNAREGIVSRAK